MQSRSTDLYRIEACRYRAPVRSPLSGANANAGAKQLKKLIIAFVAVVALIFAGLAALPLFLSAETIRTELAARITAATGRATRIDGPVSFRVIPTARLSAEGVGIAGIASDSEAFSVESVSFGLSLLPLLTGNIEMYGVTITRPSILIETDAAGGNNWSGEARQDDAAPASIEDMIATGPANNEGVARDAMAALDRLSIGQVRIIDGTLIWRDSPSGREEHVDDINLDLRVPRFDRGGTVEGNFARLGTNYSFELEVGERSDPTRFESIPATLTLSSDGGSVVVSGTALAGQAGATLFDGTVASEGNSLRDFVRGFHVDFPDLPVFGRFDIKAQINATSTQVRIDEYSVDLAGLTARGGAVVGLDRARPGLGLRIAAERIDTAQFVSEMPGGGDGGEPRPSGAGGDSPIDLSPLALLDANIDFSAKEILVGAVPVTDFGIDVQIVNGRLTADIRSATVGGAPGRGAFVIDGSGSVPTVSGNIAMNGLDAAGLVALSGMRLPVAAGTVGVDVDFATRGETRAALMENLDGKGKVALTDGRVVDLELADVVGGDAAANQIDDVDIVAEFASLNAPIEARGGFAWRSERFTISARADLRALGAGKTTPVAVNAASSRVEFGFTGNAGLSGLGAGKVRLSTPSLRNLLAWVGQPLAPGGGLGAFSIEGAVSLGEESFGFDKANFALDGSSGVGTGTVTFAAPMQVSAGLTMSRLDVTPYLSASGAARGGGTTGGASSGASGGGASGWSRAPISFDGLRAIDANLNLKADEIVADKITIGPSILTAKIAGGRLSAELTEMALYSGIGVGMLSVDGSKATPSIEAFFRLDGIDALPFLRDAAGFSRIEGTGSFSFDIRTSGDSEAALMAGLDGKGAADFRDGAIRGINIPKMVRNLSIETLLGWQQNDNEKTDFSQLAGTSTIEKGILTNRDLVLVGPLLRVTGAGTVDIPNRTLAYRVDPKIVASLEGQGASQDLEGFAVPIRIEGAWSRPRIYPEIEGILQNPEAALQQLRKLGGGLFGAVDGGARSDTPTGSNVEDSLTKEINKGLEKLLGGSGATTGSADGGGTQDSLTREINKGLGKLFGGNSAGGATRQPSGPESPAPTPPSATPPPADAPPAAQAPPDLQPSPPPQEPPAAEASPPVEARAAPVEPVPIPTPRPPVGPASPGLQASPVPELSLPAETQVAPAEPAPTPSELPPAGAGAATGDAPVDLTAPADQPPPPSAPTAEAPQPLPTPQPNTAPTPTEQATDLLKSLLGQ